MAKSNVTLKELRDFIDDLEAKYGEDVLNLKVYTSCDYGDHCHTQQLVPVGDILSVLIPGKSAYSVSGLCLPEDDFDNDHKDDSLENKVVVL